jgi:hypothetical protein
MAKKVKLASSKPKATKAKKGGGARGGIINSEGGKKQKSSIKPKTTKGAKAEAWNPGMSTPF